MANIPVQATIIFANTFLPLNSSQIFIYSKEKIIFFSSIVFIADPSQVKTIELLPD